MRGKGRRLTTGAWIGVGGDLRDQRGGTVGRGCRLADNQMRETFGPAGRCSHHSQPCVAVATTPQTRWLNTASRRLPESWGSRLRRWACESFCQPRPASARWLPASLGLWLITVISVTTLLRPRLLETRLPLPLHYEGICDDF